MTRTCVHGIDTRVYMCTLKKTYLAPTYIHLRLPQEGRGSADPQAEESHEPCAHFQADGKWGAYHHGWLQQVGFRVWLQCGEVG